MFDKYIIVTEGFRNTTADRQPRSRDGYELGIRLPYYRGLGLSMVEAIDLTVDGTPVPAEALTLTVHGNSYAVTRSVHRVRRPLGDGRDRHPSGRSAGRTALADRTRSPSRSGCGFRTCRCPAAARTPRSWNSRP